MPISGGQLKSSISISEQQSTHVYQGTLGKRVQWSMALLLATVALATLPVQARAQALSSTGGPVGQCGKHDLMGSWT
jgi:hypothetical protein